MGAVRIICPKCKRILGDTDKSIDCRMNCRGCKSTVDIKIKVASFADYINNNTKKEDKNGLLETR